MLAAGVCVGNREVYERYARPGLEFALGPDAPVMTIETDSIFSGYNQALDAFAEVPELEALVLPHQDVIINDPAFTEKIRSLMQDDSIAVVGAIGATDVRSICWWTGNMHGQVNETRGVIGHSRELVPVDTVDGLLLVLSPWAVRNLRFDTIHFDGFHGYDVDLCLSACAAGKRVMVADIDVFHHAGLSMLVDRSIEDRDAFWRADAILRAKWQSLGRPMDSDDTAARLRLEAEQAVAPDRRSAGEALVQLARTQWAGGDAADAVRAAQLAAFADPFSTLASAMVQLLQHAIHGSASARPFDGRSFVTLAEGARLIAEPALLIDYGAQFSGADDASLLLVIGPDDLEQLTTAVERAGLAGPEAAHLTALVSSRPFPSEAIALAPHVHAVLEASSVRGLGEYRLAADRDGLPYIHAIARLRAARLVP